MPGRLLLDVGGDGLVQVSTWPDGGFPEPVAGDRFPLSWPIAEDDVDRLRWYLEDYLTAPYGVWDDQGLGGEHLGGLDDVLLHRSVTPKCPAPPLIRSVDPEIYDETDAGCCHAGQHK